MKENEAENKKVVRPSGRGLALPCFALAAFIAFLAILTFSAVLVGNRPRPGCCAACAKTAARLEAVVGYLGLDEEDLAPGKEDGR